MSELELNLSSVDKEIVDQDIHVSPGVSWKMHDSKTHQRLVFSRTSSTLTTENWAIDVLY